MTRLDRRQLLRLLASLPALGLAPARPLAAGRERRILVLLELKGGNDGLNTLIPHGDPAYYALRPKLSIPESKVLKLDDGFGLHPALEPLLPAWRGGEMAWIMGLGYPHPNRSHFRSIEIWETASDPEEYLDKGWLTRVLPARHRLQGISIGGDAGPLGGGRLNVLQMQGLREFLRMSRRIQAVAAHTANPALAHVLAVRNRIQANARQLARKLSDPRLPDVAFPKSRLGRRLQTVARVIASGLDVPVFKVAHGSFDTHVKQPNRHRQLLHQLAVALAAFRETLLRLNVWDEVLVVTYSEFGRRAAENAGGGTDHGTAAAHLALGGQVKGGLHGRPPSLAALQDGDLAHTTDFRALYHTIASQWLRRPSPWTDHQALDFLRA
ncbi:MAG TPA: DUF1501 domain-containing protein [Thermopetrobacter sp.]|nr:DUF1501 domain-containing protein [Thermopetrobacter sp.]